MAQVPVRSDRFFHFTWQCFCVQRFRDRYVRVCSGTLLLARPTMTAISRQSSAVGWMALSTNFRKYVFYAANLQVSLARHVAFGKDRSMGWCVEQGRMRVIITIVLPCSWLHSANCKIIYRSFGVSVFCSCLIFAYLRRYLYVLDVCCQFASCQAALVICETYCKHVSEMH